MPNRSFRLSFDVLVTDRDRPNALATPGRVVVDVEAQDGEEACQRLGERLSRLPKAPRPERHSDPFLHLVVDEAV
jgi:hypothetical protein